MQRMSVAVVSLLPRKSITITHVPFKKQLCGAARRFTMPADRHVMITCAFSHSLAQGRHANTNQAVLSSSLHVVL
jgi:hypothetical protein